jgi:hypothetical protein
LYLPISATVGNATGMAALNHNSCAAGSAQIQLKQCIGARPR